MNYYYIRDIEEDMYSYHIATNKKCKTLIDKAIYKYERERDNDVMSYITEMLDKNGIEYKFIEFTEIHY